MARVGRVMNSKHSNVMIDIRYVSAKCQTSSKDLSFTCDVLRIHFESDTCSGRFRKSTRLDSTTTFNGYAPLSLRNDLYAKSCGMLSLLPTRRFPRFDYSQTLPLKSYVIASFVRSKLPVFAGL